MSENESNIKLLTLETMALKNRVAELEAELEKMEGENHSQGLFQNNHAVMLLMDPENGTILNANPAACAFYGWTRDELIKKNISDINTLSAEEIAKEMAEAVAEKRNYFIFQHRCSNGFLRDVEVYTGPVQMQGKMLLYSIVHDITARLQAERALAESEKKFRLSFDASPDAVSVNRFDDGLYVDVNEGFTRLTGYTLEDVLENTFIAKSIWENPDDRNSLIRSILEKGYCENLLARFRKKDGSFITGLMSARVISIHDVPHMISITRDMTERIKAEETQKKLEDQLHQAQRLESVGRLAGGIAHDFNNLLTIVLGYAELILENLSPDHAHGEHLKEIYSAALRARDLTRQLLAFGRKQILSMSTMDMNGIIRDFKSLLERVIGEDITLDLALSKNSLVVQADASQLEQVLMNLSINARDAMAEGGTLTLETAAVTLDESYAELKNDVTPGDYVMISVSDTGSGMEKDVLESIFEPFFTTKDMDKGTGLGLAMVYGIIKQHNGHLWVYSEPRRGTTFKIYLPLYSGTGDAIEKQEVKPLSVFGSATILVLEDDPTVRELAAGILKRGGYQVITPDSVEDAIKQSESYPDPIHMVLSDVVMPGMKGPEAFAIIRKHHPEAKVLYMSGYTNNVIVRQGVLKENIAFIQKPFSVQALLEKVHQILAQAKPREERVI
ncbi:MAG: PAS domain S-box protein [Proteobacteria bacterium]|nr:PAS domain S-box protein [Pseudomonadota bacterium]MBU4469023.1 PAS domain S-box protein [Pseudomonadota bacterium]MCG2753308.1 PAS domain S-box protein [Desulfobacteraceae bacterium]